MLFKILYTKYDKQYEKRTYLNNNNNNCIIIILIHLNILFLFHNRFLFITLWGIKYDELLKC